MDDDRRLALQRLVMGIYENSWPLFPCRNCGQVSQKVTNLNRSEAEASKKLHSDDDFDPEWIYGNFTAISTCQNCKDKVYIVGTYGIEWLPSEDDDGTPRADFVPSHTIKYMTPAYQAVKLPKQCPESVVRLFDEAMEVFFANPDLCANRIRTSIDALLTDQKVPRFKTKSGKRRRLGVHERIDLFKAVNTDVAELLEAVKWIGNEGSHQAKLTFADLIDGLEIYGLALKLLYDKSTAATRKKAAIINKNRGVKKRPLPF